MQRGQEASIRCLQSKPFHFSLQDGGTAIEGCPEFNDEINTLQGSIAEGENSLSGESFAYPNESYHRPMHQQDFCTWSTFHPDIQRMQQNQWNNNIYEHFYPMNREYPFPMENRFHYVPFKMFSQAYPHEFQFQEFQYFVVIDFEATCDKEKNPHPQEIIEFPSVLVNSLTGQLEASFQTYVRPIYYQLLSDFCKELTGIQQIQVILEFLCLVLVYLWNKTYIVSSNVYNSACNSMPSFLWLKVQHAGSVTWSLFYLIGFQFCLYQPLLDTLHDMVLQNLYGQSVLVMPSAACWTSCSV